MPLHVYCKPTYEKMRKKQLTAESFSTEGAEIRTIASLLPMLHGKLAV